MKVLLDTNIIIHREANKIYIDEIGILFNWIDKLKLSKYIHPLTIEELNKHQNNDVRQTISLKIKSYNLLKYPAPLTDEIIAVSNNLDNNINDKNDTQILNEVLQNRVDILISEDKKIHRKAKLLQIEHKVFTIQKFLEKVIAENPELVNYNVLAVQKTDFGKVDINDVFFDSFKNDYAEFTDWFNKKAEDPCYICNADNLLSAFLYIKVEEKGKESYSDITPPFQEKRRLKIGTLKVSSNGYKIGERFLKIVFDNASQYKVEEIYVTVFENRPEQIQLIEMLEEWGFIHHGYKTTGNGTEKVYIKAFSKKNVVDITNPKLTFPFFSWQTNKYIIKIEPQYHTELFPDSINTKEDSSLYQDNEPHRNRIGKVYISHSKDRDLKPGDIFLVYRIGETTPKTYSSTITSICIVESVKKDFKDFEDFYNACNRRTMINKEELKMNWWDKFQGYKPFIINFLYSFSLPTPKPTLKDLIDLEIIENPGGLGVGFYTLTQEKFKKIVNFAYRKKKE